MRYVCSILRDVEGLKFTKNSLTSFLNNPLGSKMKSSCAVPCRVFSVKEMKCNEKQKLFDFVFVSPTFNNLN